jgi:hypothetical protein
VVTYGVESASAAVSVLLCQSAHRVQCFGTSETLSLPLNVRCVRFGSHILVGVSTVSMLLTFENDGRIRDRNEVLETMRILRS